MPYNAKNLACGDIILVRGHPGLWPPGSWLDAGIELATLSPYAHACLVGAHGRIINPLWHVQYSPLDRYAADGDAFRVVSATPEQRQAATQWARRRIGLDYGLKELLEDGARDLAHIPLLPRIHEQHWTCSGFCAAAYLAAGVTLTRAVLPSPADLFNSPLLLPVGGVVVD